jgi:hypothetical protein
MLEGRNKYRDNGAVSYRVQGAIVQGYMVQATRKLGEGALVKVKHGTMVKKVADKKTAGNKVA